MAGPIPRKSSSATLSCTRRSGSWRRSARAVPACRSIILVFHGRTRVPSRPNLTDRDAVCSLTEMESIRIASSSPMTALSHSRGPVTEEEPEQRNQLVPIGYNSIASRRVCKRKVLARTSCGGCRVTIRGDFLLF